MDLMDLASERVKVLIEGVWREEQVEISVSRTFLPHISDRMQEFAREWFLKKKADNPNHYDGDIMHLNASESSVTEERVFLALGAITYSLYDICRKEFMEMFDWTIRDLPTGAGTCAVVVTSDLKLVLHKRSDLVDPIGNIGIIGGIYSGDHPFFNMRRELEEELGLRVEEIEDLILIGIANRVKPRINHELLFFASVPLSSDELGKRAQNAKDRWEGECFFLDYDSEKLRSYLVENHKDITAASFSGLVLAGRHMWGKEWSKME